MSLMPHYKNFDTLRLIAASSVIFSHSFLIADGHERNEPFVGTLGHILGVYGVYIFFILSGLLVTQSMFSSGSIASFSLKRSTRIYPGFFVCNVLTISFAVAFFYHGSVFRFLAESGEETLQVFAFVRDGIYYNGLEIYPSQSYIGTILNGSLWTIRQELVCYIAVGVLFYFRILNIRTAAMLVLVGLVMRYFNIWGFNKFTGGLIFVAPSFFSGIILYFFLKRHQPSGRVAVACLVLLGLSAYFKLLDYSFPLIGAYLIAYLGTSAPFKLGNAARFGDLSYGTYLYGWPVEQLVRFYLGEGAHWWAIFCMSLPLALALGFVSWHLIEKPAMRLVGGKDNSEQRTRLKKQWRDLKGYAVHRPFRRVVEVQPTMIEAAAQRRTTSERSPW
jgi:peptidoglycan/LPS O-acetylase OafA/YrhL